MSNVVIINPDRLPATIAGTINGPMRFPAFVQTGKKASEAQIQSYWFRVGPNHNISDEQLKLLETNEVAKGFLASGVIEIIRPAPADGETPTGKSRDYSIQDIRRIAASTDDTEWLQESVLTEPRQDVKSLLKNRLDALNREFESAKARAEAAGVS